MNLFRYTPQRFRLIAAATVAIASLTAMTANASAQTHGPPVTLAPVARAVPAVLPPCANVQLTTYYAEYGGYSTDYFYSSGCNIAVTYAAFANYGGGYYYSFAQSRWILGSRGILFVPTGSQYTTLISNLIANTPVKYWSYADILTVDLNN